MYTELSYSELDVQLAELLPERETLFFNFNWANVNATNTSLAVNAATIFSQANSAAFQAVVVSQH